MIIAKNTTTAWLTQAFIQTHAGRVYLEATGINNDGRPPGVVTAELETVLARRRIPKAMRPDDGWERYDHIVDSDEIGDEAVRRGLMTAEEARGNKP